MRYFPQQRQGQRPKAPSTLTDGVTARTSFPTNEINVPNGLTALHPHVSLIYLSAASIYRVLPGPALVSQNFSAETLVKSTKETLKKHTTDRVSVHLLWGNKPVAGLGTQKFERKTAKNALQF